MTQQDRFYPIFSPVLKGIIQLRRARRIHRSTNRCLPKVHLDTAYKCFLLRPRANYLRQALLQMTTKNIPIRFLSFRL